MSRRDELLKYVGDDLTDLVTNLVDEMIFLEAKLAQLKTYEFIQVHPTDPSIQRATPAAKQNKDFATAVGYYQQMVEMDPSNGGYALQLGDAYYRMSDWDNAVAALESAAANGQAVKATNLLSSVYLKRCQEALKAKQYQAALDFAMKANEYKENANAYKLAASAAQKLGNNAQCIEFYEKYLEIKPNAKDAAGVTFTIAALYQQLGNNAKAIENYEKVASDPQYGAGAQEQLKVLKK